jgi:hypothetical protein
MLVRAVPLVLLAITSGCTGHEYDLVEPAELAGHVGTKSWANVRRDELEYRLRTADDRLVMLIYNRGERPMKLLGPDSAAIDPRGESHPLHSATILPGSHVRRVFPPPRPIVERYGEPFAFGYGGSFHHRDHFGYGAYDDLGPRYYSVHDPNDPTYFTWPGGTGLRLLLTYQRGLSGGKPDDVFRHEFTFRRRKM